MKMWNPAAPPAPLDLPIGTPQGVTAAWIPVRATEPTAPPPDVREVPLVNRNEAMRFKSAKRAEEHASGRYLLAQLLFISGYDPNLLRIDRDAYRRPMIAGLDFPPSVSIAHSGGVAAVVIGPNRLAIGLDLEPLDVTRQRNILPLMASPGERKLLGKLWDEDAEEASVRTTELWVAKEAILKATGLGMGLAPQSFTAEGLHEVQIPNRGIFHILRSQVEFDGRPFALSLSYQN